MRYEREIISFSVVTIKKLEIRENSKDRFNSMKSVKSEMSQIHRGV